MGTKLYFFPFLFFCLTEYSTCIANCVVDTLLSDFQSNVAQLKEYNDDNSKSVMMIPYLVTFAGTAHRVQTKNMGRLISAIHDRPKGKPLVTVSNHSSCIDDPVIWGETKFVLFFYIGHSSLVN